MSNEGTSTDDTTALPAADTSTEGPAAAVTQDDGEVTKLRSRAAGLDAKVSELTNAIKEAEAVRKAAEQKLSDYEAGKVGADEALRAQLTAKETEAKALRDELRAARIEAKYPEALKELGVEAAVLLGDEKLASIEARLQGGFEDETKAPTPRGTNGTRQSNQPSVPAEQSFDDILASLRTMPVPDAWSPAR